MATKPSRQAALPEEEEQEEKWEKLRGRLLSIRIALLAFCVVMLGTLIYEMVS